MGKEQRDLNGRALLNILDKLWVSRVYSIKMGSYRLKILKVGSIGLIF